MSLDKFERSNHMKKEYQYKTTGNCRAESVVQGKDWRFTVLTPALIRMEYNADGIFEDRATQAAIANR